MSVLFESMINRNHIVETLRAGKKLKDITPEHETKKVRVRELEN